MKSPIARGLLAAARLTEWAHRRIHGPKYAPGDVVEYNFYGEILVGTLRHKYDEGWWEVGEHGGDVLKSEIIRVVRYGEGG